MHLFRICWGCNPQGLERDTAFAVLVDCAPLDLILCFLLPRETNDYYQHEPMPGCLYINITLFKGLKNMPFSAKIINDTEIPAVTHLHWYFLLLFLILFISRKFNISCRGNIYMWSVT